MNLQPVPAQVCRTHSRRSYQTGHQNRSHRLPIPAVKKGHPPSPESLDGFAAAEGQSCLKDLNQVSSPWRSDLYTGHCRMAIKIESDGPQGGPLSVSASPKSRMAISMTNARRFRPPDSSAAIPVLGLLVNFRLLRPWFLLPRAQMIFESNVILELTQ